MSMASKWFVPDAVFFAATEDYAVVGREESAIRPLAHYEDEFLDESILFEGEGEEEVQVDNDITIKGETYSPMFGNTFGLGVGQQLLYADVDCNDPQHLNIRHRVAAEGCLKEESEKCKEAREKLIEQLVNSSRGWDLREEETDEWMTKEREYAAELLEHAPGVVSHKIVDYLLSLKDQGERREALHVLSGQHLRKTQRPVLLLIGMVNKYSTERVGTDEGWTVVYNFYEDRLIIQPFFSDETHHPLMEKWDTDLPDDGISFSGRTSGIVERFWKIHEEIQDKEYEKDTTAFGHGVLVNYFTMKWIVRHWEALCAIKHVEDEKSAMLSKDDLPKLEDAKQTILEAVGLIKLECKKQKPATEDDGRDRSIGEFKRMQGMLEMHECFIREDVVKVKKAGGEVAAQNAAKLYGRLLEQLRSFNLDPEKEI
ncbi:MAG: hypothetical protein LQ352_004893 [Teloschistes flavicans]|nr:MAG: hypothetical protein LQ352_004893 [Teloschistes flavicans]